VRASDARGECHERQRRDRRNELTHDVPIERFVTRSATPVGRGVVPRGVGAELRRRRRN
jgi:hypothetical protein